MSHDVDAIYDNGVFRPLEPLSIPDGVRVHLRVDETGAAEQSMSSATETVRRRAELDEFRRVMAELPLESPDDGFSGKDYDRVLYGKP